MSNYLCRIHCHKGKFHHLCIFLDHCMSLHYMKLLVQEKKGHWCKILCCSLSFFDMISFSFKQYQMYFSPIVCTINDKIYNLCQCDIRLSSIFTKCENKNGKIKMEHTLGHYQQCYCSSYSRTDNRLPRGRWLSKRQFYILKA